MMESTLTRYLNQRLGERTFIDKDRIITGPVITISREVGCNGLKLANSISQRLNKKNLDDKWKVLSKEIFLDSAKELHIEPEKVRHILERTDKYTFDEILDAFNNRYYKSDRIVIKSVIRIIRNYALQGHCIIVGRAGHVIAKNVRCAFHIRLFAPLEYRIQNIMENKHLKPDEAFEFIQKVEKERIAFRKAIQNETEEDEFFDLHINRASFGDEQILDIIEHAIEKKQILKNQYYRTQYY